MTSFCFPPRRLLLFSLSLVLYIGHRSFSSSRGVPGTEPYLVPRFNGRQLASQARPGPTGLKNLKSLERAYLVSPSVSPCLDCVCGAPIDRILTTIIMIKKSNNYKRVNDDDADVATSMMMLLKPLMMMDLMELMWAAMNHCNFLRQHFKTWADSEQSLEATFVEVFFHDFRSGAGGFSNSESVIDIHLEVRVVHTIKLTVEVSSRRFIEQQPHWSVAGSETSRAY